MQDTQVLRGSLPIWVSGFISLECFRVLTLCPGLQAYRYY